MKLTITSLIAVAAALIMAAPLKAQSLQEVTAERNKVYVEIVDEFAGTDDAFLKDEWEDVTNYSAGAGMMSFGCKPPATSFCRGAQHVKTKKQSVRASVIKCFMTVVKIA